MMHGMRPMLWLFPLLLFNISHYGRAGDAATLPALASSTDTSFYQYRSGIAHGTVLTVSYTSYRGLSKTMRVYLPPNYDATALSYPALYLSHGMGGNDTNWTNGGYAHNILDNLISEGKAVPMIVVMPRWDGQYFGLNLGTGPPPLGDDDVVTQELIKDIIPYVESHYRTKSNRLSRAIAGLSLGGYVTLNTGMRRLDVFSEIFLFSPFDSPYGIANLEQNYQSILTDPNTNEQLALPLYLAMGDLDTLLAQAQGIDALLTKYGINHYYVSSSGAHEWMNWRRYLHQTAQIMFPAWTQQQPGSSITLSLPASGAASASTLGPTEPIAAGYASASVDSASDYGTAVIRFQRNGVVVSETGVPASPPTTSARFFVDFRTNVDMGSGSGTINVYTGFAVVNTGTQDAILNLKLRDTDGATVLAQGTASLPARTQKAGYLHELGNMASGFSLPAGFAENGFGSLEVTSTQPVSVVALRLTENQRGDQLITTIPVADLVKSPPSGTRAFSHVVDGGGYQSTLVLMNTSDTLQAGTLRFYTSKGGDLTLQMTDQDRIQSSQRYSIPAGGIRKFVTDGVHASEPTGWAQIEPDAGMTAPLGALVFGLMHDGVLTSETGVPAVDATTHALIYVDMTGGHDTGIAVANPGSMGLRLAVKAVAVDGITPAGTGTGNIEIPAKGHAAAFAYQMIDGLPDRFQGVLDLTSSEPFSPLTLRALTNSRGDFLMTTFPIADVTRAAPAPLVFPQIVSGGGYESEIILLNAGGAASAITLQYIGNDGKPIAIGR